ncbi:hypothetical protein HDV00_009355 [Rhizophlyctis rosea]|nr:hypothetical protein HDV00_009355 [Rhizophlyctis rosea]
MNLNFSNHTLDAQLHCLSDCECSNAYVIPKDLWEQSDQLNAIHRAVPVEWLRDLLLYHEHASTDTLQLAVNLVDRVCNHAMPHLKDFQRLGAACFLIAAKTCETQIQHPYLSALCNLSKGSFDVAGLKKMELHVLKTLR